MERGIRIGHHVIALLLTGVGTVRAVGDGIGPGWAIAAGLALIGWYATGAAALGSRTAGRRWFLVLAVLWLAACVISPEFIWWAFVIWLLAGHLLTLRWALAVAAAAYAVTIAAPIVHHGGTSYATVIGPLIGGVFAFGISRGYGELLRRAREREELVTSLRRAHDELADLQDELALAQRHAGAAAERARIARDLHDTVAQGLASIRLLAHARALPGARIDPPQSERGSWLEVEHLARTSLSDSRRIIGALAPAELETHALPAAIDRIAERFRARTGIAVDIAVDESWPPLPAAQEIALLRTAQSALANIELHAAAGRVVISLIDDGADGVRLDILDDGRGFDIAAWHRRVAGDDGAAAGMSFGLVFMRSRLTQLGGGLDIESTPGDGTALSAHLPVPRN